MDITGATTISCGFWAINGVSQTVLNKLAFRALPRDRSAEIPVLSAFKRLININFRKNNKIRFTNSINFYNIAYKNILFY